MSKYSVCQAGFETSHKTLELALKKALRLAHKPHDPKLENGWAFVYENNVCIAYVADRRKLP